MQIAGHLMHSKEFKASLVVPSPVQFEQQHEPGTSLEDKMDRHYEAGQSCPVEKEHPHGIPFLEILVALLTGMTLDNHGLLNSWSITLRTWRRGTSSGLQ
jgi:hypothetical protein